MGIRKLWVALLVVVVLGGASLAGGGRKSARGFWCFSATHEGWGSTSTCARKRDACKRGVDGMSQLGATVSECAWQKDAWSTRIAKEVYLFATKASCEQQRDAMGGTKCKRKK